MVRKLAILTFSLMLALPALPTTASAADVGVETSDAGKAFGPRKQIATIVFAGLAGAILGLSTLSFYGRPQDKLSNIAVGFAVGIISGTIFTTYKAATQPRDFYDKLPGGQFSLPVETEFMMAQTRSDGAAPELVAPVFAKHWSF